MSVLLKWFFFGLGVLFLGLTIFGIIEEHAVLVQIAVPALVDCLAISIGLNLWSMITSCKKGVNK